MPIKDPVKRRAYRRRWYAKNKESEKEHVKRRKLEIRNWFRKYKLTLSCSKCSENHPATLEFHHKDPKDKKRDVTMFAHHGWSIRKIKEEISKCRVLCANCHRKEHNNNF